MNLQTRYDLDTAEDENRLQIERDARPLAATDNSI
jgi:plasmid maintenance system antidote protein VapI